ncbi:hypothetical protein [Pantoea cypripedii]|uniref:Uncharacterized protein n=1 Tax=Pantoea cypripedii TaxID=55209 RepID=A0A1X1EN35_PANCY|nr:hypothetical protein [Pantoea cypripedii]MBP2199112.1 hypothetical protein [Pantoea cypripedii]ORM90233.1 hypothetical protein HA50_27260 [Pantoea cypripedii]
MFNDIVMPAFADDLIIPMIKVVILLSAFMLHSSLDKLQSAQETKLIRSEAEKFLHGENVREFYTVNHTDLATMYRWEMIMGVLGVILSVVIIFSLAFIAHTDNNMLFYSYAFASFILITATIRSVRNVCKYLKAIHRCITSKEDTEHKMLLREISKKRLIIALPLSIFCLVMSAMLLHQVGIAV